MLFRSYYDFIVHNRRLQFGLAVYSKYPLIHKHSIPFNSPGNSASRCDIVLGPDTFRLFNVHLQSNAFQSSDIDSLLTLSSAPRTEWVDRVKHQPSLAKLRRAYAARTEQVRLLQREMDDSPYPVILCGDFNDVPVSYTYRQLTRHLSDAFRSASPLSPAHTFVRRHLGVRIDYILHSPSLRAASFRVAPLDYSDHYPVATTLYW